MGFASVLFEVGSMTLVPAIVPKEQLNARNSLISGAQATTQRGGPSLGGLLVQLFGAVRPAGREAEAPSRMRGAVRTGLLLAVASDGQRQPCPHGMIDA